MRILITGGTGALGRALVARLLHNPLVDRLAILSRDEHKIKALCDQYRNAFALRTFVGCIRDRDRLELACSGVDAVIHAAALKRVDADINDTSELDKTNVQGTINVLHAALSAGVRKVLLISSDKAVHPANAYGTSKMMAELHTVGFNSYSVPKGLRCSAVRYGNVFASTGSVVHIWRKQIADGQCLTVTDPRMTRFHLTLAQAAEFVITSIQRMRGGEIFVPILPSFRLYDLAQAMTPRPDRTIAITGLRPGGEKLHESLLSDEEPLRTMFDQDRYCVKPSHQSWSDAPYPGVPVKPDMIYRSDVNDKWLSADDLRVLLKETP